MQHFLIEPKARNWPSERHFKNFTSKRAVQVLLDFHNLGTISQEILKHIILYLEGAQLVKAGIGLCEFAMLMSLLNCLIFFILVLILADFASFAACIVPSYGQEAYNTQLFQCCWGNSFGARTRLDNCDSIYFSSPEDLQVEKHELLLGAC